MAKPILAILTDSIRYDNHIALKYFQKFQVRHFYNNAPYGDLTKEELKNAIKWDSFEDLEKKLLKLKPDIIQGSEPYASRRALRICLLTMKVARKLGVPYIFPMLENRPVNARFGKVTAFFLKKILKNYAKKAAFIFYLNKGAKRNLLEVGANPKKMLKMLYGIWGVDTDVFKPSTKNVFAKPTILYSGRFDEAKGIKYIMEAWESIKNEFPKIQMVFMGRGGDMEELIRGERVIKLGKGIKVRDLPPYYASPLFTVCPSVTLKRWEEQIGMVNLQSLSCGVPVITTKSGAIPEYINDKVGILVPERDSKALANAMKKLLKNDNFRKNLGKNARRYILANFDAQKTIKKIEEILIKLL